MKLTIHDVGHGSCISLIHENGNVMLWDCGHKKGSRPSGFLPKMGVSSIDRFFVTNYDEDHISDLPFLRQTICIGLLHRNDSISPSQLSASKLISGPITSAMKSMLQMMDAYSAGPPATPPAFPGVFFNIYCNSYLTDFSDTNNISLVTILNCNGTKFIIPGDIEKEGWKKLLQRQDFCADLADINVFIASHHGRESGYCADLFNYCSPGVFVFSDSAVKYATQETVSKYASHARGVSLNGKNRYILTTRYDGDIFWNL